MAALPLLRPQLLPSLPKDEPTCSLLARIHLQPPQSAIKRPDKNTELLKALGRTGALQPPINPGVQCSVKSLANSAHLSTPAH